jgi:hypothetical protein
MVQKVPFSQTSGNTVTIGTGASRVIMGADSGNLKITDSQANVSVIEAGLGVQGGAAVTVVANNDVLAWPASPAGTLSYSSGNNTLFISNGSGWYKITTVNTSPNITLSVDSIKVGGSTGNTLDVTYTVVEPEGTPTTVTFANSGIANASQATIVHTTANNTLRITNTKATDWTGATLTVSATDGVNTGTDSLTIEYSSLEPVPDTVYDWAALTGFGNDKYNEFSKWGAGPPALTAMSNGTTISNLTWSNSTDQMLVGSVSPYGPKGYCMYFEGNDYLDITDQNIPGENADFEFGSGAMSIEMWFMSFDNSGTRTLFEMAATGQSQNVVGIKYNASTGWQVGGFDGNDIVGSPAYMNGIGLFDVCKWHHIAMCRDASDGLKFYVDGILVGSATVTGSATVKAFNRTSGTVRLGATQASAGNYFKGYIADVRIVKGAQAYAAAFTPPTETLADYSSGTTIFRTGLMPYISDTKDLTGRNYMNSLPRNTQTGADYYQDCGVEAIVASPYNMTSPWDKSIHGGSALFPTRNRQSGLYGLQSSTHSDVVAAFELTSSQDFSLECWVYIKSFYSDATNTGEQYSAGLSNFNQQILSGDNLPHSTSQRSGKLWIGFVDGELQFRKWGDSNYPKYDMDSATNPLQINTWYHIAGTRISNVAKLYINGQLRATESGAGIATEAISSGGFNVGTGFSGHITDVRFMKGQAAYTGNFTPPNGPLTQTGGKYPSETNVNVSMTATNCKILWNFEEGGIVDPVSHVPWRNSYGYAASASDTSQVKFSGIPTWAKGDNYQTVIPFNRYDFDNKAEIYKNLNGEWIENFWVPNGYTDYTLECWVRFEDHTESADKGGIFQFQQPTTSSGEQTHGPGIRCRQNTFRFFKEGNGGEQTSGVTCSDDTWYHVAITRQAIKHAQAGGHSTNCFVNGVLTNKWLANMNMANYYKTLFMGACENWTTDYSFLNMGDFRWTRDSKYPFEPKLQTLTTSTSFQAGQTVTASNTKLLTCHAASISDGSAGNHSLTTGGNAAVSNFAPIGGMYSVYFDGTGDYITTPSHADFAFGSGAYCMEAWIWRDRTSAANETFWGHQGYNTNNSTKVSTIQATDHFVWYYKGAGSNFDTTVEIPFQKWTHIAVCRKGTGANQAFVMINGSCVHTGQDDSSNSTADVFSVGGLAGLESFKGYISNMRVVKGQSVYDKDFQVPQSNLYGITAVS